MKVLREKLRQDKTAVARFLREAHYGERVVHPNVVRTIEVGEAGPGLHFLAIEWAEGELLERYAKQHAPTAGRRGGRRSSRRSPTRCRPRTPSASYTAT